MLLNSQLKNKYLNSADKLKQNTQVIMLIFQWIESIVNSDAVNNICFI